MTVTLLQVADLRLAFGGLRALGGVSFDVHQGEVFTLIGPNGAGKTTVFNVLSRIYSPNAGTVRFADSDLLALAPHRVAELGIARTFQNIELFEQASVLQNLLIGRHIRRRTHFWQELVFSRAVREAEIAQREQVEKVIDLLDMQNIRDTLVAALPYGQRKVVELARALACEPRLLLLDEPSSGLNVEETDDMAFWIQDINQELGITVLLVEHDMSLVSRVSHRVLAMNHGEVVATGSPAEVQAHPGVIEAYLGAAAAA
jgi:branched-chain amino acid transport system ATP-binding protein